MADSHCHLDIADPPDDWLSVDDALAASTAAGVPRIVQIGCDLPGARWAVETANRYAAIVAGVALHPNEAPLLATAGTLDAGLAEIDALAADPVVRALGETGLDHYRTGPEGRADQEASFRAHIEMAKRHGKALVIHDRDAHDEVIRILEDAGPPERVVFHCFSGDAAMAEHCVRRGWWMSFAGTVTFKNAAGLREALARCPLDRLLVETDAPYLTPVPYRGRPERVLPGAAHGAGDGACSASARTSWRGRDQHGRGIWHLVTDGVGATATDTRDPSGIRGDLKADTL